GKALQKLSDRLRRLDRGENFHPATATEFFTTIPDTLVATMRNVPKAFSWGGLALTESTQAARDVERFAGHPRRIGRRQKHGGGRDVLRLSDAAKRRLRFDLLAEITAGYPGGMHAFGFDHAGVDRVDADVARPQLFGQRPGHG